VEVQRSSSRPPWKVRAYCRTGQSQRRDVQYACSVHMYQCINELWLYNSSNFALHYITTKFLSKHCIKQPSTFHFDLSLKFSQREVHDFSGEMQKISEEVQYDLRGGAHCAPFHTSLQNPAMVKSWTLGASIRSEGYKLQTCMCIDATNLQFCKTQQHIVLSLFCDYVYNWLRNWRMPISFLYSNWMRC
jgi:hypothetical protein